MLLNHHTLNSRSTCFSANPISAVVNFWTLGVATCLWNSGTSMAVVNIYLINRTAPFRVGIGSFFFVVNYMRWLLRARKVNTQTESIGNATPNQPCAHSIIVVSENIEVLCARQRPAHRLPESFEWSSELIRMVHFGRWGEDKKYSGVREVSTYGR